MCHTDGGEGVTRLNNLRNIEYGGGSLLFFVVVGRAVGKKGNYCHFLFYV